MFLHDELLPVSAPIVTPGDFARSSIAPRDPRLPTPSIENALKTLAIGDETGRKINPWDPKVPGCVARRYTSYCLQLRKKIMEEAGTMLNRHDFDVSYCNLAFERKQTGKLSTVLL